MGRRGSKTTDDSTIGLLFPSVAQHSFCDISAKMRLYWAIFDGELIDRIYVTRGTSLVVAGLDLIRYIGTLWQHLFRSL